MIETISSCGACFNHEDPTGYFGVFLRFFSGRRSRYLEFEVICFFFICLSFVIVITISSL